MGNTAYKPLYSLMIDLTSLNGNQYNVKSLCLFDNGSLDIPDHKGSNESVSSMNIFMGPRSVKRRSITPFMIITDNSLSSLASLSNHPSIIRRLIYLQPLPEP